MLKLYFNDSNMQIIVNSKLIEGNFLVLKAIGEYCIQIIPTTTAIVLQPIFTTIALAPDNTLHTALQTIKINNFEYYLMPNFLPYIMHSSTEIIEQTDENGHRITNPYPGPCPRPGREGTRRDLSNYSFSSPSQRRVSGGALSSAPCTRPNAYRCGCGRPC